MRRARIRLGLALVTLALVGGLGLPAAAVTGVAGNCELVNLQISKVDSQTRLQSSGGFCTISDFDTVSLLGGASQTGTISLWSDGVSVRCGSGNSVQGVTGTVTFTVKGSNGYLQSFPNVSFILDSSSSSASFNPAATIMLNGLQFAGTGAFTRQGSGNCASREASWTFGHVTFEDPTL